MKLVFIINLACISDSVLSQPTTWQRIFGGPRDDIATTAFQTRDGNYLMVGEKAVQNPNNGFYISQTYLIKFNIYGNVIWEIYYGDSVKFNYPTSAIEMSSGNILITYVSSTNNEGNLLKLNPIGNVIWDKTFTTNSITGFFNLSLVRNGKNILINGDYFTGSSYLPNLSKLDTNGNLIWSRPCNDNFGEIGFFNSDEGYYSAGQKSDSSSFVTKRDTSGNLIWKKIEVNPFGGYFFRLLSMTKISSKSYFAIGNISNNKQYGLYLLKIDTSGKTIFGKDYLSDSVSCTFINKTLINQYSISGGSPYKNKGISIIIDSLGNIVNIKSSSNNSETLPIYNRIYNCSDSGFIIAGDYYLNKSGYSDFLLIKTDKNLDFNLTGIMNTVINNSKFTFEVEVYPNPFNPKLNLKINLGKLGKVQVEIYDITGRQIVIFPNIDVNMITTINIKTDNINMSSGFYFVNVRYQKFSILKKVIYIK